MKFPSEGHKEVFHKLKLHFRSIETLQIIFHSYRQLLVVYNKLFHFILTGFIAKYSEDWSINNWTKNKKARIISNLFCWYFLMLHRACSLKLAWQQTFSVSSLNFKLLLTDIPNNATKLVSWIRTELIFIVILLQFLFRKIISWNFYSYS